MASKARTNKSVKASKTRKAGNIYAAYFAACEGKSYAARYAHLTKVASPAFCAKLVAHCLKLQQRERPDSDWIDPRKSGLNAGLESVGYHPIVSMAYAVDQDAVKRQFKTGGVLFGVGKQSEYEAAKAANKQQNPIHAAPNANKVTAFAAKLAKRL